MRSSPTIVDEPELGVLVSLSRSRAAAEQVSQSQVIAPLFAEVFDDMGMGDAMPRRRLEHEHVAALCAGIASVDPSRRLQPAAYGREFLIDRRTDGEVDDRLREQSFDRRRADLLHAHRKPREPICHLES